MAEWSIAVVLKTTESKAPGVRIPLPPLDGRVCVPLSGLALSFAVIKLAIGGAGGDSAGGLGVMLVSLPSRSLSN